MRKPRGRLWLALWMIFALSMMLWVVARQTSAVMSAARLDSLRDGRSLLDARRIELLAEIRRRESREVLEPIAVSLGLRESADTEIVIISAPDSAEDHR
ncbi:MAG: hypothetical protein IH616_24600 [Gemmatimonadales bacterium]|nr:hypothetical protein [Gemmatimonadales bacterium]